MKKYLFLGLIISSSIILSSCVTVPPKPAVYPPREISPKLPQHILRQDVVHLVAPGETIWRISKMYDVPMQDIMRANNLGKEEVLKKGENLLIPRAAPVVPVIPIYPSKKWKYIIIHHSATDEGSSLYFDKYHQGKGWEGIGYHFVINNGTGGKQDGQIEVSPRWIKQEDGSHCRANNMNERAIGICLVGNFNREYVSSKQLDALVYLVNILRRYYKIPLKRIMGHNQVLGARTECPGKNFSWTKFKNRL
ncbi:MAG: N-acetylmuramoyl-L-alanine amidase [Candidatus Omnitrophota bacterium]|nr:N-acetylmuramoyl-L-alanine amidase [Candidatus Omnitrophota bacterium]